MSDAPPLVADCRYPQVAEARPRRRHRPLLRAVDRLLGLLPLLLSVALLGWTLSHNPFARPFVERTAAEARSALAVAMAGTVTRDWYDRELGAALAAEDFDRTSRIALTGARQGLAPTPDQLSAIEALEVEATGAWAVTRDCAICIADPAACPSLRLLGVCALPVELTPVGDLNALRRAGMAAWNGTGFDRIEVALAITGLGATGAALASGGSSLTVKAGATALRLARRLGTLTPRFGRELARLADIGLRPDRLLDYARGTAPLEEVVDTVRLARLSDVTRDLTRVAGNTSLADTVVLLRYVDDAEDAGRLARLSDAAGERTLSVMETLGKTRAFRTLLRLSHLALSAAVLAWLVWAQVAAILGERLGRLAIRLVRAGLRPALSG